MIIASIVDRESFEKQCTRLDSATRDYLNTRLDYYQVNMNPIGRHYRAHSNLAVIDNSSNIRVTSTTSQGYKGIIWDVSIHKYTVTAHKSKTMEFMVGFAPSKLFDLPTKRDFCNDGWYLFLKNGKLISKGDMGKAYSGGCKVGDTITCIYNALTNEISFEMNGVSLGVAYTNVNGEDIAPAVELYHKGDAVTLSIV
jgi:SPRY domain